MWISVSYNKVYLIKNHSKALAQYYAIVMSFDNLEIRLEIISCQTFTSP